jgi:hypothetical protein
VQYECKTWFLNPRLRIRAYYKVKITVMRDLTQCSLRCQTSHIIRTSEETEWKILENKRQIVTDSWIKLHTVIGKSIPLRLPDFKTIGT